MTLSLTSREHADELTHRDNLLHDAWTQIDALQKENEGLRRVVEKARAFVYSSGSFMDDRERYLDLRAALDAIEVRS